MSLNKVEPRLIFRKLATGAYQLFSWKTHHLFTHKAHSLTCSSNEHSTLFILDRITGRIWHSDCTGSDCLQYSSETQEYGKGIFPPEVFLTSVRDIVLDHKQKAFDKSKLK